MPTSIEIKKTWFLKFKNIKKLLYLYKKNLGTFKICKQTKEVNLN
jgi:hypothetical protein